MRLFLIGCEVILRELCAAAARSPHLVNIEFQSKGLHDRGAKAMRTALQEAIDAAEARVPRPDAILLGYGLCGNGLAGLEARTIPLVVPRAHDCITLLMGDRDRFEAYFREHPGTYYRSAGWVERGGDLEPLARAQTGAGATLDELVARYGEDNGRFLFEELNRYRRNYRQLAYIRTEVDPDDRFEGEARAEAGRKGWSFERLDGSLALFDRLFAGAWDAGDFLVVPPGGRIAPAHDDRVMTATTPGGTSA
jgi:hypothetical protein